MATNSLAGSKGSSVKIPAPSGDLQYNFCKNPHCSNFGIEPDKAPPGSYSLGYAGKAFPVLKCNACGESPPMKSNLGIADEIQRLSAYLQDCPLTCPVETCSNHTVPVGTKKAYRSFGTTASGAKRYQCGVCHKTFSEAKSTQWQRDTHHNIDIFKFLVNKVPLSRIVSLLEISWSVLYNRIDFIHQQCLAFAADRERELQTLEIPKLYLAVDRQNYEVNWTERKDRRNIVLSAMASADNLTGYVFGVHPNFDFTLDNTQIEQNAIAIGDAALAAPFRKYARLWLQADYQKSVQASASKGRLVPSTLTGTIAAKYAQTAQRDDIEAFDSKTKEEKLPSYGCQVKAEYTMIAHFYFLRSLMGNVQKWRFFLDQESGIRSACLSGFKQEVANHTAEAFYVSIQKELTVDQKRRLKTAANQRILEEKKNHPTLSDSEIKLQLLKQQINAVTHLGSWKDKWVQHPFPSMSEPAKAMCWLTEHQGLDPDHQAWLYDKASLHAVDSFFQKIRRRMAMFERAIHSQGNHGRTWNGYAAYNPAMVVKLLDIFRVVHNYVDTRKDGKEVTTPAMRLGLAKAPIEYKSILYFSGKR